MTTDAASSLLILPLIESPWNASIRNDSSRFSVVRPGNHTLKNQRTAQQYRSTSAHHNGSSFLRRMRESWQTISTELHTYCGQREERIRCKGLTDGADDAVGKAAFPDGILPHVFVVEDASRVQLNDGDVLFPQVWVVAYDCVPLHCRGGHQDEAGPALLEPSDAAIDLQNPQTSTVDARATTKSAGGV